MNINRDRFCINRKIAPALSIEEFFKVVKQCGLTKVEMRNDMPSGKILDDLTVDQFNALTRKYGLEVITINALYPFNLPSARAALTPKAEEMLEIAKKVHCKAIIMCPYNEKDTRTAGEREVDTANSIKYFTDLFAKYGIQGLVEPLGFPISSLRSYNLTEKLITSVGSPFKLVLDTFHHHLAGLPVEPFHLTVDVQKIGLVHLSAVEDTRPTDQLTDEERLMFSPKDVLKSKEQVMQLEKLGYKGIYAFEPFSSTLNNWGMKEVEQAINESIDYICN